MVKKKRKNLGDQKFADLDERLRLFRKKEKTSGFKGPQFSTQENKALRMGVELLSGVLVGAGIGLLLDKWLGTSPVLLIVMFFLGSATGVYNVFKITKNM